MLPCLSVKTVYEILTSVALQHLPGPALKLIHMHAGQQGWLKGVGVAFSVLMISYNWQLSSIGQNFLNKLSPLF